MKNDLSRGVRPPRPLRELQKLNRSSTDLETYLKLVKHLRDEIWVVYLEFFELP